MGEQVDVFFVGVNGASREQIEERVDALDRFDWFDRAHSLVLTRRARWEVAHAGDVDTAGGLEHPGTTLRAAGILSDVDAARREALEHRGDHVSVAAQQRAARHVLAHDREHRIEIAPFAQRVLGFDSEAAGGGDGDDGLETPDVGLLSTRSKRSSRNRSISPRACARPARLSGRSQSSWRQLLRSPARGVAYEIDRHRSSCSLRVGYRQSPREGWSWA